MLNEDLLDKKDKTILRLKLAIKKYKEYEAKRKAYYEERLKRLAELEKLNNNITKDDKVIELQNKIKQLKEENKRLHLKLSANKIITTKTDEELKELVRQNGLKEENKRLRTRIKSLSNTISDLICQLNNFPKPE